jgi:hypothetical protein
MAFLNWGKQVFTCNSYFLQHNRLQDSEATYAKKDLLKSMVARRHQLHLKSSVIGLESWMTKAIGADATGATGAFAPVIAGVLGRGYTFAPVLFWLSK